MECHGFSPRYFRSAVIRIGIISGNDVALGIQFKMNLDGHLDVLLVGLLGL